jgi:hypothetical protein
VAPGGAGPGVPVASGELSHLEIGSVIRLDLRGLASSTTSSFSRKSTTWLLSLGSTGARSSSTSRRLTSLVVALPWIPDSARRFAVSMREGSIRARLVEYSMSRRTRCSVQ